MSTNSFSVPDSRMQQISTRIAFFVAGFGLAAWAPIVPYVKERTALPEAALGLLMLCLGLGSILSMPVAGVLSRLYGCRIILLAGAALVVLTLPVLAMSGSPAVLALALALFGVGIGSMDCVVNIQAVIVERASGRSMMSGFHAMFSVGGLAGAGAMALMLAGGMPLWLATAGILAVIIAAMAIAAPHLLNYGAEGDGPAFAVPRGAVLLISVLCFILFLAEGAVLDWSAVFLTTVRGMDAAYAGIGYFAFAATMAAGRLTGDMVTNRVGPRVVLLIGPVFAAGGLFLTTAVATPWTGVIGFALVGIGCANVVPVLFSAIGRQKSMPEHIAIPAVTTIGYAGILAGPALIGFLAQVLGLSMAFAIVGLSLLVVAAAGQKLKID